MRKVTNQQLSCPLTIHYFNITVQYAAAITLLMFLDNLGEFLYLGSTQPSVAYLFFNTSVCPAGLFSRYLVPCLLFQCVWQVHRVAESHGHALGYKRAVTRAVFHGTAFGGVCNGLSRIVFLLILSLWFPFTNDGDFSGNFIIWPYYVFSLYGKTYIHQMFIVLYGILYGFLWGSYATLCYAKRYSFYQFMIIPFFSQIVWLQVCLLLQISSQYRIDCWFYMSSYYHSYALTALLSCFIVISCSCITVAILNHGGKNSGRNCCPHKWSIEEESGI